jgi:hypothetical protein
MGALKGSPCQVKNVVHQDGINTVTFEWEGTDGTTKTRDMVVYDGTPIYVWESGNTYHYGDLAIYESQFYRCIVENNDATFDSTKWNEIGSPDGNYDIVQSVNLLPARFTAADRKLYYVIDENCFYLWNGTAWVKTISNKIADLDDVNLDDLTEGDVLVWDSVNEKWVNKAKFDEYKTAFTGTEEEWDALTSEEQNVYDIINITNDGDVLNLGVYLEKKTAMPVASEDVANRIYLYTGTTTQNYKKGVVYQCVSNGQTPTTYSWVALIDFGTAAIKNSTDRVLPNSTDLVESRSVYSAINNALSSIYTPRGDITCAELTSSLLISDNIGNVYEVSDSGTTTALFLQGAGHPIAIGDNVGIINAGQGRILFNLMANAFDLTDYQKKDLASTIEGQTTVEGALGALSTNKADKVSSATNGNFAGLDASGNLNDSGKKPSDFQTVLTFDNAPTENSNNPVKSGGVYSANQTLTNRVKGNWSEGGKNLLPNNATTQTINGVAFTVNSDGSITANGTATRNTNLLVGNLNNISNGDYILTGCPSGGSGSTYYLALYQSDVIDTSDRGNGKTFTKTNAMTNTNVSIVIANGVTVSNLTFYPMIRLASDTDDTYVPYAKTNQQLTQDTTSFVTNLNANGCKNHFKVMTATYTYKGITITANADGSITLDGTCSEGTPFYLTSKHAWSMNKGTYRNVAIIDSGTITCPSGKNAYFTSKYDTTQYTIPLLNTSSKVTRVSLNLFTIANDGDTIDVYFYIDTGVVFNNCTIYPMILDSDCTDYSWSPYAKSNKELTDDVEELNTLSELADASQITVTDSSILEVTTVKLNKKGSVLNGFLMLNVKSALPFNSTLLILPSGFRPSVFSNCIGMENGTSQSNCGMFGIWPTGDMQLQIGFINFTGNIRIAINAII